MNNVNGAASLLPVRWASKKSGKASRNQGKKPRGKAYGWKIGEGAFVRAGHIIATHRLIRWHPGSFVGMGRRNVLYALEDGVVRYTKEVYVPRPKTTEGWFLTQNLPKGSVIYKTFINVVPTPQEGRFRLQELL
uniref:large ribosomal subunit protein bL27m isoform X2 n=1 Tax=Myxine glutinosa TaxID=7769 RepID=UPI00358FE606